MPRRHLTHVCILTFHLALPAAAQAPDHFGACQRDGGTYATVLLPTTTRFLPAAPAPPLAPDEIAVFTPEGLCAGATVLDGENAAIAVWMDDPLTPEKDGFAPGEPLAFRIWLRESARELPSTGAVYDEPFEQSGTFRADAIYLPSHVAFAGAGPSGGTGPDQFALEPNYPNPFSDRTTIRYGLPEAVHVRLEVYDLLGRRVATLVDEEQSAGWHTAQLDATDLASGTYVGRLQAGTFTATQRMLVVR